MNYTDTLNIITTNLSEYGIAVFIIISAVVGVGVAYLVFRFGWHNIKYALNGGTIDWNDLPRRGERYGIPGRNTEVINPNGHELIFHSADDLEFKRNYGRK